ncbi:MAG: hypothetical protein GY898_20755 [Proteobacteria bacterium]|nr:hypothetical protein [Pseudomonadota bacterium]
MADTAPVRGFLDFVVGSLLSHPGDAQIDEVDGDKNTRFELSVHDEDLAYLNADEGRVGQAIATMVDACAYKHRLRAELVIGSDEDAEDDLDDDDDDDDEEVGYDDEDDD